jgi:hypothetical protein
VLFKAFDTAMALSEFARRVGSPPPPAAPKEEAAELTPSATSRLAGQVEARLTNVVVAALKEAFDRDHARLELERVQMEEQRRRAEEAMRLELRRQAIERELGRLRLLAGTALVGWVSSIAMLAVRLDAASPVSRIVLAAGWLLLLGALAAAFTAQARIGALAGDHAAAVDPGRAGAAALWLLTIGLAVSAVSLLVT